jgi:hypothetical protein
MFKIKSSPSKQLQVASNISTQIRWKHATKYISSKANVSSEETNKAPETFQKVTITIIPNQSC